MGRERLERYSLIGAENQAAVVAGLATLIALAHRRAPRRPARCCP